MGCGGHTHNVYALGSAQTLTLKYRTILYLAVHCVHSKRRKPPTRGVAEKKNKLPRNAHATMIEAGTATYGMELRNLDGCLEGTINLTFCICLV